MPDDPLNFRPAARIQRFLGRELIADPNVAIVEFVKNSYDAGASQVSIEFALGTEPTTLTMADDGTGMTFDDFRANWMRPGFSEKADEWQGGPKKLSGSAADRRESRTATGEKGIGRLSAGRLGERLDVWTRRSANQPWLHVHFDWRDFEDMETPLDEVPIAYDFSTAPPKTPFALKGGTVVVVAELSQRWDDKIPGRPVRGRSRTRLGRLRQDLEFLLRPLTETEFSIELLSDRVRDAEDVGRISPRAALENAEYAYSFKFDVGKDNTPTITRSVSRSSDAAKRSGKPRTQKLPKVAVNRTKAKQEGRPETLNCGSFSGTFVYTPPPALHRAREIDESPVGVLLYRDGVLVEPYGIEDNDWVGARARKAQRQGHAPIQPDTFAGHVLISRRDNKKLRDQANRLGLLENAASENFLAHVRAEFSVFEALIYDEVIEPRWEGSREKKASLQSRESQERARIFFRSLAHSLRQPLTGVEWDIQTLKGLADRSDIPEDARALLREVQASLSDLTARAQALVREFLEAEPPEFSEVMVSSLVRAARAQVKELADAAGVKVVTKGLKDEQVLVAAGLIKPALAAVLSNGIEAARPSGTSPTVTVSGRVVDGDFVLAVSDNGTGIRGAVEGTPLTDIKSTKGRPAAGLLHVQEAITASKGRVRIAETGASGTRVEILLPMRIAGLVGNGT